MAYGTAHARLFSRSLMSRCVFATAVYYNDGLPTASYISFSASEHFYANLRFINVF
jgi:hypothetical protein